MTQDKRSWKIQLRLTINSSHYQQLFHRFLHRQFWLKPFLETKNHQKNRGLEQPGCEAGLRSSSGEMMKVPWFRGSRSLLRLNGELLRSFWKDNIISFSYSQFIFSFFFKTTSLLFLKYTFCPSKEFEDIRLIAPSKAISCLNSGLIFRVLFKIVWNEIEINYKTLGTKRERRKEKMRNMMALVENESNQPRLYVTL